MRRCLCSTDSIKSNGLPNRRTTALQLIHSKAVESRERGLLFALSELNYLTGEHVRRSVKRWEPRDARDYYLASAVYAWFFLFGEAAEGSPGAL